MIDLRIYRAAFLPAIAAVVALLFSLERVPEPIQGPVSTPTFEGSQTARLARSIATRTPARTPGSEGDNALAGLVRESFTAVTGGEVSEQRFSGEFDGASVDLQNVVLTLPGRSPKVLLVVAGRDSPAGQGATTSAAATAILLRLAEDLGSARHEETIVLASVPGSLAGPSGIPELVDSLEAPAGIDAAIAITQPGTPRQRPPFVFGGYARPESISPALLETAAGIASTQFDSEAAPRGGWSQFARLAFPVGVGDASALADAGLDAIAVSGSGERPPPPDEATPEAVSSSTVFAAGTTALDLLLTLDERASPVPSGPDAYIRIGDNLLPGWTLKVLALALLLPALVAAADVWLRERRRSPRPARRSVPWALERVLPPLAGLLFAYALGLIGLIPDPAAAYDPGRFPPGAEGPIAFALIAMAFALAAMAIRPMRTPLDAEPQTLAAAAGLLTGLAVLGIWLLNPFLALLLTPTAHIWLLPARAQGPPRARLVVAFVAAALIPVLLAGAEVASSLELGALAAPWHLLLLVVSGQIGPLTALLWCALGGGLLACIGATGARSRREPAPAQPPLRGPGDHVGPGALGGTPSSLPRA